MQYTACHIITVMARIHCEMVKQAPCSRNTCMSSMDIHANKSIYIYGKLQKLYGRGVVLFTVVKQYNSLQ